MTDNKILGNKGEALAKKYLLNHGYKIISCNYYYKHLEIDLIGEHQGNTIFIEVKTRIKTSNSLAENPLHKKQTKNLQKAINNYCFNHHLDLEKISLDLIIILVDKKLNLADLKHYKNIF